jgi:hypothetical protein
MAAEETYDLYITFVGLCMLVDDEKRMHVLLPSTKEHAHVARLLYNPSFNDTEEGDLDPDLDAKSIELEHLQFDLSGLKSPDPLKLNFRQSNVFDLTAYNGNRRVERHLLDTGSITTEPSDVITRVTLGAGKITLRKKGSVWKIGTNQPDNMATSVQWRIRSVPGSALELPFKPLDNKAPKLLPSVKLRAIDREIRIWIYHVPSDEVPKHVPRDPLPPVKPNNEKGEALHFVEFYNLLPPRKDVPVFVGFGNCPSHETPPTERGGAEQQVLGEATGSSQARGQMNSVVADTGDDEADREHTYQAAHKAAHAQGASEHSHGRDDVQARAFSGDEVACILVSAKAAT